jgi:hypothetical protein
MHRSDDAEAGAFPFREKTINLPILFDWLYAYYFIYLIYS